MARLGAVFVVFACLLCTISGSDDCEATGTCDDIEWPQKTRDIQTSILDSTAWDSFQFRPDDVIVATYCKAGTTWMQHIVSQLIFLGAENIGLHEKSVWVDLRVPPTEVKMQIVEAQTHRRFLKTHLPVDALRFSPMAKYIYVGRDGRDIGISLFHHHHNANQMWYELVNETPGRVGPPIDHPTDDVVEYFNEWVEKDGFPFWSLWESVRSWWAVRDLPNVHLVHYADLKHDLRGEIEKIADFLDIEVPMAMWPIIVDHCSLDYMRDHAADLVPLHGDWLEGGAIKFVHKGTSGQWHDVLPEESVAAFNARAAEELDPEAAAWLNRE